MICQEEIINLLLNLKQFTELNRLRELYNNFMISKGLDLQKCEVEIFRKYRGRWTKKNKKKKKKVSIIIRGKNESEMA